MTQDQNDPGGGPTRPKDVKVVHEDAEADGERQHFERQIVKRPWSRG